jgi:hypothetical protein
MDLAPGRNDAFASGMGAGVPPTTAGLQQSGNAFNGQVPGGEIPTSVLQPNRPSGNGWNQDEYNSRVLPGGTVLNSEDGSSPESWSDSRFLNLSGQNAV